MMSAHVTKRFFIFDGTWCDRNLPGKPTLLASLVDLIQGRGHEIRYFAGLGTRSGLLEKYIGGRSFPDSVVLLILTHVTCPGGLGRGIERHIIEAIDHLVTNYCLGDQIVFIGFSRGAYIARSVVGFLDRLGIPECNKDHLHKLYEMYTSDQIRQRGVADHLRAKYNCEMSERPCQLQQKASKGFDRSPNNRAGLDLH